MTKVKLRLDSMTVLFSLALSASFAIGFFIAPTSEFEARQERALQAELRKSRRLSQQLRAVESTIEYREEVLWLAPDNVYDASPLASHVDGFNILQTDDYWKWTCRHSHEECGPCKSMTKLGHR